MFSRINFPRLLLLHLCLVWVYEAGETEVRDSGQQLAFPFHHGALGTEVRLAGLWQEPSLPEPLASERREWICQRELSHPSGQKEELGRSSLEDWVKQSYLLEELYLFSGHGGGMGWIQGKPSHVCGCSDSRLGQHWRSWWREPKQKVCRSRENPQIPPLCLGFEAEFSVQLFVFYLKRTNYLIIHFIDLPLFIFTIKFNSWIMCLKRWAAIANNEIEYITIIKGV